MAWARMPSAAKEPHDRTRASTAAFEAPAGGGGGGNRRGQGVGGSGGLAPWAGAPTMTHLPNH